jgi:hypothetical protein
MGDEDEKEPRSEEFDRFEDLTRKLLAVPKDELKRKLDEHRSAAQSPPSIPLKRNT